MSKNLFITGTGTDIGKTFVSALIVKKLASKAKAGYYKAAMSGNLRDKNGNLIPGDAKFVKEISGIEQSLESMCPYVYENAYSPHLASRVEGNPVSMDVVKSGFLALQSEFDYLTMEGSGGILCPIDYDKEGKRPVLFLEDIIRNLALNSIIVADAGLGTINSLVLTANYMAAKNLGIKGIIFNHFHKGNIMQEDNIYMCEKMTGLKTLALVSDGDNDLAMDFETLAGLYE
ncbi:dethiobiotin synthase [Treponema zioleckii]|uniref:dethiobiotin synthase n=1 Tax=Treponema zioleckii TaxID=331680 RepID=UPI00168BE873|nr:dethiobiotin synthase [Treponema zioleckii]